MHNNNTKVNFYTQGQRFAVRGLLIIGLLGIGLGSALATYERQEAIGRVQKAFVRLFCMFLVLHKTGSPLHLPYRSLQQEELDKSWKCKQSLDFFGNAPFYTCKEMKTWQIAPQQLAFSEDEPFNWDGFRWEEAYKVFVDNLRMYSSTCVPDEIKIDYVLTDPMKAITASNETFLSFDFSYIAQGLHGAVLGSIFTFLGCSEANITGFGLAIKHGNLKDYLQDKYYILKPLPKTLQHFLLLNTTISSFPDNKELFASPGTLKSFTLSGSELLSGLPENFFLNMTNLKMLDLSGSNLSCLPNSLDKLRNLEKFDISDNSFQVDCSVGPLKKLASNAPNVQIKPPIEEIASTADASDTLKELFASLGTLEPFNTSDNNLSSVSQSILEDRTDWEVINNDFRKT